MWNQHYFIEWYKCLLKKSFSENIQEMALTVNSDFHVSSIIFSTCVLYFFNCEMALISYFLFYLFVRKIQKIFASISHYFYFFRCVLIIWYEYRKWFNKNPLFFTILLIHEFDYYSLKQLKEYTNIIWYV